jgi:hypothetical protein
VVPELPPLADTVDGCFAGSRVENLVQVMGLVSCHASGEIPASHRDLIACLVEGPDSLAEDLRWGRGARDTKQRSIT